MKRYLVSGATLGVLLLLLMASFLDNAIAGSPPPGPVSWWAGEGNANDSADGNNGTLAWGAGFGTGKVGQGFRLDGYDDYVSVPDAPNLDGMGQLTVAAWVCFNSLPDGKYQIVVSKGAAIGPNTNSYLIWLSGETKRITVAIETEHGIAQFDAPDPITVGRFYHVALTYDGATVKLYLDGALRNSVMWMGMVRNTGYPFLLGKRSSPGLDTRGDVMNGVIDEVLLYGRALTEAEIRSLSASTLSTTTQIIPPSPSAVPVPGTPVVVGVQVETSDHFAISGPVELSLDGPGGFHRDFFGSQAVNGIIPITVSTVEAPLPAGQYALRAAFMGADNYVPSSATGSMLLGPSPTITDISFVQMSQNDYLARVHASTFVDGSGWGTFPIRLCINGQKSRERHGGHSPP